MADEMPRMSPATWANQTMKYEYTPIQTIESMKLHAVGADVCSAVNCIEMSQLVGAI